MSYNRDTGHAIASSNQTITGLSSPLTSTLEYRSDSDTHGSRDGSLDMSPLPSPSASTFLRTAATLEGLSRQLGDLKDDTGGDGDEGRCCCGATGGCATWAQRDRMEDKLKLSGGECTATTS